MWRGERQTMKKRTRYLAFLAGVCLPPPQLILSGGIKSYFQESSAKIGSRKKKPNNVKNHEEKAKRKKQLKNAQGNLDAIVDSVQKQFAESNIKIPTPEVKSKQHEISGLSKSRVLFNPSLFPTNCVDAGRSKLLHAGIDFRNDPQQDKPFANPTSDEKCENGINNLLSEPPRIDEVVENQDSNQTSDSEHEGDLNVCPNFSFRNKIDAEKSEGQSAMSKTDSIRIGNCDVIYPNMKFTNPIWSKLRPSEKVDAQLLTNQNMYNINSSEDLEARKQLERNRAYVDELLAIADPNQEGLLEIRAENKRKATMTYGHKSLQLLTKHEVKESDDRIYPFKLMARLLYSEKGKEDKWAEVESRMNEMMMTGWKSRYNKSQTEPQSLLSVSVESVQASEFLEGFINSGGLTGIGIIEKHILALLFTEYRGFSSKVFGDDYTGQDRNAEFWSNGYSALRTLVPKLAETTILKVNSGGQPVGTDTNIPLLNLDLKLPSDSEIREYLKTARHFEVDRQNFRIPMTVDSASVGFVRLVLQKLVDVVIIIDSKSADLLKAQSVEDWVKIANENVDLASNISFIKSLESSSWPRVPQQIVNFAVGMFHAAMAHILMKPMMHSVYPALMKEAKLSSSSGCGNKDKPKSHLLAEIFNSTPTLRDYFFNLFCLTYSRAVQILPQKFVVSPNTDFHLMKFIMYGLRDQEIKMLRPVPKSSKKFFVCEWVPGLISGVWEKFQDRLKDKVNKSYDFYAALAQSNILLPLTDKSREHFPSKSAKKMGEDYQYFTETMEKIRELQEDGIQVPLVS